MCLEAFCPGWQSCVNTWAGPEVGHQSVALAAAALVAALWVGAVGFTASVHNGAFIDICHRERATVRVRHPSRSRSVKTSSGPELNSPESFFFSFLFCWLTHAALPVWCGLVTGVTGALVGSRHVDALAVPAQVVAQLTLVDIWQDE